MLYESYLELIVKPLLTKPEKFNAFVTKDDLGVLLHFSVAKEDMPRVVGKEGATMTAVRTLVRQFGSMHQARLSVKLDEPETAPKPLEESK